MRIYDKHRGWVEVPDEPVVDHSQNPIIGIVLLAVVLYLAWLFAGSPAIIITGVLP